MDVALRDIEYCAINEQPNEALQYKIFRSTIWRRANSPMPKTLKMVYKTRQRGKQYDYA